MINELYLYEFRTEIIRSGDARDSIFADNRILVLPCVNEEKLVSAIYETQYRRTDRIVLEKKTALNVEQLIRNKFLIL